MLRRLFFLLLALNALLSSYLASVFLSSGEISSWREVLPAVYRCQGEPAGYMLVDQGHAILIDAPFGANIEDLTKHSVKQIDFALLTHHHRDSCWQVNNLIKKGVHIRGPKASAPWLTPEGVENYWKQATPLRTSRTAYLVVPKGVEGLDLSLENGQRIHWRNWEIQVLATPGHTPDHVCYLARRLEEKSVIAFCGDCLAGPGKIWTPYTTDWDHWTDVGMKKLAESLRLLASQRPKALLPAHGQPLVDAPVEALELTTQRVEKAAQLKSFEYYTKHVLGNPPSYRFLAPEQSATAGEKPWSQLSPHLYLTGNTYVLVSKQGGILVVDPWGKRSAEQIARLQREKNLGAIEVVMISHAHYDHYDGLYELPEYRCCQVWTLDVVAEPLRQPFRLRHPFLDARPLQITHTPRPGDTLHWREYSFRFHHLPGQTYFTMGVEVIIDQKRCLFTGDNWFHHDQYSGSGGWMGLNRGLPNGYLESARLVLNIAPDWILAEHGSAMEFNLEDFRRRVRWAEAAREAADDLCVSGDHRRDWNPHRVAVIPFVISCHAGQETHCQLQVENPSSTTETLTVECYWPWSEEPTRKSIKVGSGKATRHDLSVAVPGHAKPGQYVVPLRVLRGQCEDPSDVVLVLQINPQNRKSE